MGLTPPLGSLGDVWLDLKQAKEKAQLVGDKLQAIEQIVTASS